MAVLRKDSVMAELLCSGIEPGEVVATVILHLQRVRGEQRFAVSEVEFHPSVVTLEQLVVTDLDEKRFRAVHRENQPAPFPGAQRFAVVIVVQILEEKAFEEGTHLARDFTEIDRTAQNDGVRPVDLVQHGGQVVAQNAAVRTRLLLQFAGHAADAAPEFEIVEIDHLCFRACRSRSVERLFQQRVGIATFPGTPVDRNYFHCS